MKKENYRKLFLIVSVSILPLLLVFAGENLKKWDAVKHDSTNFPLLGKHRTTPCGECHLKGVLQGTPTECEACHWYRKQDDRYQVQLGIHCSDCHTPMDWKTIKPGSWDHGQVTGFTLQGSHRIVDCFECHKDGRFTGERSNCFDCHQDKYRKAEEPDHDAQQFPEDCTLCHNMLSWEGAVYRHTGFQLNGMHRTAGCNECHTNNVYEGTPNECVACHLDDYNRTTDPNHKQVGYSTDCEKCHGRDALSWEGTSFDHNNFWPLSGAHRGLSCNRCHQNGFDIPSECVSCHLDDYNNTRDPNHRQVGFHTDCQVCHPPEIPFWSNAIFDHRFPIFSGNHSRVACSDCHTTANYYEFSCIDCHEHNKNSMDNEHKGVGGYSYNSQACYSCHPTGSD